MKTINITASREVKTTITRKFELEVEDDFDGFSKEEIDKILNDEIYELNNPEYISLDVEYDVETLQNSDNRPMGDVLVRDNGKQIQYYIIGE